MNNEIKEKEEISYVELDDVDVDDVELDEKSGKYTMRSTNEMHTLLMRMTLM